MMANELDVRDEDVIAVVAAVSNQVGSDPTAIYLTMLVALALTYRALPNDIQVAIDYGAEDLAACATDIAEALYAEMVPETHRPQAR
jgi:hypothetical protein